MDRKIDELASESARKACHEYFENKNVNYIVEHCRYTNVPLLGVLKADWNNQFIIDNEHQHIQLLSEDTCVVSVRMSIFDKAGYIPEKMGIDATFVCQYYEDDIKYCNVHISKVEGIVTKEPPKEFEEQSYKKTLKYIYDVVFEYDSLNNSFSYDPEKYNELFQSNSYFVSMDQWFWNMCTECVLPEDAELLDIFRSNDIGKRVRNDDCVVEDDIRIRNKEKGYIWIKMVVVFIPNEARNNIEKIFVMFKDIDEKKKKEIEYKSKSRVDFLTGVYNREYMEELIKDYIDSTDNPKGIYIIIDIDEFKKVNDTFGHITGDELLATTAKALYDNVGNSDIVGRLGGDEFAILLKNCDDEKVAKSRITNILKGVQFEYSECQREITVSCSAGAAIISGKDTDLMELYERADRNLYEAKNAGKNTFRIS